MATLALDPLLAAAAGDVTLNTALRATLVLFGTALVVAWSMRALRLPAILGFLLAGIVIGPSGLDLIPQHKVEFFAELGLVLLLFSVGLELSPAPLLRMGGRLLAAAGLQIGLTAAAAGVLVALFLPVSGLAAAIIGVGVALSSTAIVLKHLSERGEIDTPAGAITTGILLIQDLAVILVLALLPLLAAKADPQCGLAEALLRTATAFVLLGALALIARRVLPFVIRHLFRFGGTELMTLFAIVMACAGAWLASLADWSWPLGAFIAGLVLAQSELRHQVHAEITPFRDALNALFFIAIGMLVDTSVVAEHAAALGIAVVATLVLKTGLVAVGVTAGGWPVRLALTAGLGLCTISEFGYVLVSEAVRLELVPASLLPAVVAWIAGTMLLGALLVPVAPKLAIRLAPRFERRRPVEPADAPHAAEQRSHVIIVGYGINGRNLARVLRATAIPHVVVEMHPGRAGHAREDGAPVIVGDAARLGILELAGLSTARALVVSIADADGTRRIVAQMHGARPELYILARTRTLAEIDELHRLGAQSVIPEEFETSIEIFAHVLKEFAIPDNVVDQQVAMIRAGHYGMLRGRALDELLRNEWRQMLEAAVTQTFYVAEDSPACGETVGDLDLRNRTGVTIVAVTRDGRPIPSPKLDFQIQAADVLVLVGTHHALDRARRALSAAPEPAERGT